MKLPKRLGILTIVSGNSRVGDFIMLNKMTSVCLSLQCTKHLSTEKKLCCFHEALNSEQMESLVNIPVVSHLKEKLTTSN